MPTVALLRRALANRMALPLLAVVVLLALAVNEWMHRRNHEFRQARAELTEARLNTMAMLQLLTDAETSQRGYLITGREEYLEPYRRALAALPEKSGAALSFLRGRGGAVAGQVDEAAQLLQTKLSELDTTVTLQQSGQRERAQELVLTNLGKETMDRLRSKLDTALTAALQHDEQMNHTIEQELKLRRWAIHALLLLIALAVSAYARKLAEEAREREAERSLLETAVQERTADLRDLAAHLQSVQEAERASLARELHDEIGGLLTAAKLDLTRLRTLRDPDALSERVKALGRRLDEVTAIKRRIIEGLRPSSLEHLGLRAALELLCQEVGERLDVPVDARIDDAQLTEEGQITAYRIVQEALTNVQKYAGASQVQVRLAAHGDAVELSVADDGKGFDVNATRVSRHGLAGMRYRVEALGGSFVLDSAAGRGTRILARLPAVSATATAKPAAA